MNRITPIGRERKRRLFVVELEHRPKVRELASFLGLDADVIAEGLVEAMERDPALRRNSLVHHAA